ncbi:MAG: aromatic ring-hydroxylating dioxygenase subunit alpha [Sphingomonas sp.]|uniref:aromatic ring-hydroxylating oxygenase subunit alpha n=1 Tax=Sphingomonas sp. TaxID=28214 RepID=UPI002636F6CF|nr:aromatic ring-hydroxylating dioxygenase subunit alpha [Sphingomonas sp.]MDK2766092.1 aromatic ring-hydroxylating dioxygenase subunit alpha [Sphingomonas sp.]
MAQIESLIREGGVHARLYTNESIFDHEMAAIFGSTWIYVGHESEIPARGDYLRRTMGKEPVILTRSATGVSVLSNRCSHRGNLLCQLERGKKRAFACQYHGWVFSPGGELLEVPFAIEGEVDRSKRGLRKARVATYRGFIFATFNEEAGTLEEHLGNAAYALDRACDLSPQGEIMLRPTWVRHLFQANWKMLSENEADGYHVNFVHDSFAKGVSTRGKYGNILQEDDEKVVAVSRYLGNGHTEADYGPTYSAPMTWLGVQPDRYPEYTRAMHEAYGAAVADERMRAGPPHTFIFPNLFLAETSLVMIQPISVNETINWHTPMYLKGAPEELNRRILRQGEVALGPSAFLTADDAIIAERQWLAISGSPAWLDIGRGKTRERRDDRGVITSHYTDESASRGFWEHYKGLVGDKAYTEGA